jgi:serine/threonine protein kinase
MIITEYKADDGDPKTAVASADTVKVILETKLAMDYHSERKTGTLANRTIAIAMNTFSVRVFILEAEFIVEDKTPKKLYHKLYHVPGIEVFRATDISRLISLMLFRLEDDYWKLFNSTNQNLQKAYRNVSMTSETPKKSIRDNAARVTRDVSSRSRSSGDRQPGRKGGAEDRERDESFSSSSNDTVIVRIGSTIVKEKSWKRSIGGRPVEVYALEKLSKFNEFVELKAWSPSAHSYKLELEALHDIDFSTLDTQTRIHFMYQALVAVQHMHSCGIIHRDIKTSNCMQRKASSDQLVMIDFDLAVICEDGQAVPVTNPERPAGTLGYIAPEMYTEQFYDSRIDIFSCGIMFAEWHTGVLYHKFGRLSVERTVQDLTSGSGKECEINNLILRMVCEERDNRISVEEALAHCLFSTVKI